MLSRFSHVQLFVALWTIAHQPPLSMGFSRQEYWTVFPYPPPGDLPNSGLNSPFLHLLHRQVGSLPLVPPGKPHLRLHLSKRSTSSTGVFSVLKELIVYLGTFATPDACARTHTHTHTHMLPRSCCTSKAETYKANVTQTYKTDKTGKRRPRGLEWSRKACWSFWMTKQDSGD